MVSFIEKVHVSHNVKFVMDGLGIHPKMNIFMGGGQKKKITKEKLDFFLRRESSASGSSY